MSVTFEKGDIVRVDGVMYIVDSSENVVVVVVDGAIVPQYLLRPFGPNSGARKEIVATADFIHLVHKRGAFHNG